MSNEERYRGPLVSFDVVGVDREADAIRGAAILQIGDIRRDVRKHFVDATTLEQFVSLVKDGIPARWAGDPETHGEGLGTYLGRWSNARVDGDKVRMDLNLSPHSHTSPRGDIGKYTLDMAETDPDMLGPSMVVNVDRAAMNRERRPDGFMPIRLKEVRGADIVDTPALVSGMFSAGQNLGDDDMSDAMTKEQFDAGLESLGKSLAESITASVLATVEEKFAAITPKESDEPTADELRAEGAKRASSIMTYAALSGLNDHAKLAQDAIDANQTVETFKASLADRLINQNKLSKGSVDGDDPSDPHAKFRAEFKAGRESFASLGIVDEELYVRSRCRDEGLDVPEIKKAS